MGWYSIKNLQHYDEFTSYNRKWTQCSFSVDPLETLYYDYKLDSKILKASIKIKESLRDKLLEDTCTDVDNFIKSIRQDAYLYGKIIVSDCPPDLWADLPKGFKVKTLKLKDDKTKWI